MMGPTSHYHGNLVAFEGPQDTISTQLRLLPNSPNILIIPPLRHFMREHPDVPFDARSHILMIHKACSDRVEIARAFLRDSTPNNKRLVFMNGGTASAQVECVSDLSKHLTNGDFEQAERIFKALVRNGVAGLYNWHRTDVGSASSQTVTVNHQQTEQDEETPSDPASAAMRAAEALDLETAFLQPNNEIDLTTVSRRRSTSTPIYRLADDFQNAAPFYVFGARRGQNRNLHDSDMPRSPRRRYTTRDSRKDDEQMLDLAGSRIPRFSGLPSSPSCSGEEYSRSQLSLASLDLSSSHSFGFESAPSTPAIREAFAINVRSTASTSSHKQTRSVDRIYASAIRNQDILLCSFPTPPRSRPQSGINHRGKPMVRSKFFSEIPRPTFSTPNRPTARRGPPTPLKLDKPLQRPLSYVDHGTNPINNYVDRSTSMEPESPQAVQNASTGSSMGSMSLHLEPSFELDPSEPFETVLPMLENLVLLFKGEKLDMQLEATIQAFKEGIYPINMPPVVTEAKEDPDRLDTPSPHERQRASHDSEKLTNGVQHEEVTPTYQLDSEEYDPFAYEKYPRPPRTWLSEHNTSSRRPSTPPTPAQTPPLTERKPERCFHDFMTTSCRTAVCMQNSLRSILNIYFPPADAGYHQFNFPLLPELSSLWKPVFREADSGTVIKRKSKVDLILAIGAQKGVDKDFLGAISGSLEKLGAKPNGVTRSGRLDLRFLIASAMQAFTSQPLANQTQDNPFTNPLLLATLIIPHLETYLAAHSATRFLLLEYPPEHLSTVLSLQRLVGVDLLRVAGVLDAEIDEPKPSPAAKAPPRTHAHTRTNSKTGILSVSGTKSGATLLSPTGSKQGETPPPFSKANYILTSSANESEIARLISAIWKILIDVSSFYIPEGAAIRSSIQLDDRPSQGGSGRPLAQTPLIRAAQRNAPLADAAALMRFETPRAEVPPPVPSKHRRRESAQQQQQQGEKPLKSSRGSISETIRSSKTVRTMRSQRNRLKHMLGKEAMMDANGRVVVPAPPPSDTASAYHGYWDKEDDDEEEDYGFAAEERKYMPLYGRENGPRKGNSRKALKWLGLAT
ncbi:hypothetical protein F4818DRAFT_6994 [Hypoxylon cercidicola]|nr:hypothetical protein F4818DRAFT_6994 [Hypoxylon cercidicola]